MRLCTLYDGGTNDETDDDDEEEDDEDEDCFVERTVRPGMMSSGMSGWFSTTDRSAKAGS